MNMIINKMISLIDLNYKTNFIY